MMGFRLRRSIAIIPGVRLNLSKRGVGLSVGVRGARVTLTADGKVRQTLSIPGTGLSWVSERSLGRKAPKHPRPAAIAMPPPPPAVLRVPQQKDEDEFRAVRIFAVGAAIAGLLFLVGLRLFA